MSTQKRKKKKKAHERKENSANVVSSTPTIAREGRKGGSFYGSPVSNSGTMEDEDSSLISLESPLSVSRTPQIEIREKRYVEVKIDYSRNRIWDSNCVIVSYHALHILGLRGGDPVFLIPLDEGEEKEKMSQKSQKWHKLILTAMHSRFVPKGYCHLPLEVLNHISVSIGASVVLKVVPDPTIRECSGLSFDPGENTWSEPETAFVKASLRNTYVFDGCSLCFSLYGTPVAITMSIPIEEDSGVEEQEEDHKVENSAFIVTERTKIAFERRRKGSEEDSLSQSIESLSLGGGERGRETKVSLSQIGGMEKEINEIIDFVKTPFEFPEAFRHYKMMLPRGLLIFGIPGTGKSLMLNALENELKSPLIATRHFHCASINEDNIMGIIADKDRNGGCCIVFLDQVDIITSSKGAQSQRRLIPLVHSVFESLPSNWMIVATTNQSSSIDSSFRRPGRFDREIELPTPNTQGRGDILKRITDGVPMGLNELEWEEVISKTHGYVGADLSSLCHTAVMNAIKRDKGGKGALSPEDFEYALRIVKPSALREIIVEIPRIHWSDVGGLDDIKKELKEVVEWPLKYSETFRKLKIRPPSGILLYGPPGCSKTMLAKALATESGLSFLSVKGPELFSKFVGESERAVRELFQRARSVAPSIILFDEIDALAIARSGGDKSNGVGDRVLSQLLTEMDGIETLENVIVLATTNRPDIIDLALLRPCRLDRLIYVPPPDYDSRLSILKIKLKDAPKSEDIDVESLAKRSSQFSGAEIVALITEASIASMREDMENPVLHMRHFEEAFRSVTSNITQELLKFYENFREKSITRLKK